MNDKYIKELIKVIRKDYAETIMKNKDATIRELQPIINTILSCDIALSLRKIAGDVNDDIIEDDEEEDHECTNCGECSKEHKDNVIPFKTCKG